MSSPAGGPAVVAYVPDLMDRSRLAGRPVRFVGDPAELVPASAGVGLVVVDLSRQGVLDPASDVAAAGVRVVGFAPHVDDELRAAATAAGIEVVARSRFFGRLDDVLSDRR